MFFDIVNFEFCIFVNNYFNKDSISIFINRFRLASVAHSFNLRSLRNGLLFVLSYNSARFGAKSIIHSNDLAWNHLQEKLNEYDFFCHHQKA